MPRIVTLLTDFGLKDPYVGVMKGAILMRCPEARLIDLTHDIERQNVSPASFWLERSFSYFPRGSVHLAVVDPGVGTARRPLAARIGRHYFVAPDNGILDDVLRTSDDVRVVQLDREEINPGGRVGTTFDGRDLFSPAAGMIAAGAPLSSLGRDVDPQTLTRRAQSGPAIRVIDHYGNLISDAPVPGKRTPLKFRGRTIPWANTYGDVEPGQLVALASSWNTIEIAANQKSAEEILDASLGDRLDV